MKSYQKMTSDGEAIAIPVDGLGRKVSTITANTTLTADDSGGIFLIATDALTVTLPATIAGWWGTFINTGAAGHNIITIAPVAADGICGTITLAASIVTRVGTVNTALVNTKTTATLGDSVTIVGTGNTGTGAYVISSATGIWA
jgi:hypothetical protein